MRKTKKLALTLSVLGTAFAALAAANLDFTTASAATVDQGDGIFMNYGASVRCNVEDLKNSGIRYELRLTTAAYSALSENETAATFGVLIAPAAYEDTAVLNAANVFGVGGTKVYDWAVWNEAEGGYVYDENSELTRIVNVSTTVDFETTNLNKKTVEGVEYYYYYGSMTGIRYENLAREFVGVGYVSTSETDYTFATRNDNERSIAYVAQQSILKDTTNLGATEEEQTKAKAWLQKNYVDEVKNVETTYTVEHRVATNIGGGYIVSHTTEETTTVDAPIDLQFTNPAGLVGTAAANNDVKAMANDKSTLVVNYTYAGNVNVKLQGNTTEYYAFKNHAFYWLTEENKTNFTGNENGIFYNGTNAPRTISVNGSYGAAAIIDANGLVIEGRDGANGRLVNAENPVRSSSTATCSTSEFAKNMTIPVGGFAIVTQNQNNGTSSNVTYGVKTDTTSLRNFMYQSIISNYGNCVQIAVDGADFSFTQYQPVLKASAASLKVNAVYNGELADETLVDGVTATLVSSFDGAGETVAPTVTVKNKSAVNLKKAGTYAVTLTATYGELTQDFGRSVVVGDTITISVGASTYTIETANTATNTAEFEVDEATDSTNQNDFFAPSFRLFTPSWTGGVPKGANSYSAALILDSTGKVVIASGALTAEMKAAEGYSTSGITNGSVANFFSVWEELNKNGDYYLLIAPNDNTTAAGGNNCSAAETLGAREFIRGLVKDTTNNVIGQQVTISYFNF